ncbi:MAG: N-acetyl-gamma-glutamyl-phosphate reductase [Bacillota bacterium]
MSTKIFIDGKAGTTGLRIFERLQGRQDIQLILLSDTERKDYNARKTAINKADVVFLCLPDDAAKESVSMIENDHTAVIDASTAHRTNPDWTYGFSELSENHEKAIANSKRIAVPGCHASGFIALTYPLVKAGIINKNAQLSCHSITGYSGGGKGMIADFESETREDKYSAPQIYGITQAHKHLPEMAYISGLENPPVFVPVVADFYSGMLVTIPLSKSEANGHTLAEIKAVYKEKYNGEIVKFVDEMAEGGFISANKMKNLDSMEISVCGNDERMVLTARYDNLGKGASGAAVEALNILLGVDKKTGLEI